MKTMRHILAGVVAVGLVAGLAAAKDPKVDPAQVRAAQQLALKQALDKLVPAGTLVAELNHNKQVWNNLPPEKLRQLRDRYYAFLKQAPGRQADLLEAAFQFEKLSDDQKRIYLERAEWLNKVVAGLSPAQREELQKMSPDERARKLYELKAKLPASGPTTLPSPNPPPPVQ